MDLNSTFNLLRGLAEQLPSIIVMIVCIGFAIAQRKRYPKVSLLIIIGLVLFIVHIFVFAIVYTWVPAYFIAGGSDEATSRNVYLVLGLISNTGSALYMALLLAAVFTQRSRDARVSP